VGFPGTIFLRRTNRSLLQRQTDPGNPFYVESMLSDPKMGWWLRTTVLARLVRRSQKVGRVTLQMDTAYPFEMKSGVKVERKGPRPSLCGFAFLGWCVAATVEVNGIRSQPDPKPGTFLTLQRRWSPETRSRLHFRIKFASSGAGRPEFHIRVQCAAVERGPLVFALPGARRLEIFCRARPRTGSGY